MHFNPEKLISKLLIFINCKNLLIIRNLIAYENFQDNVNSMLITGKKNYVGYLDEILLQSGVENGHSNEKIAEKTSLFFSSLAKSAMNWCLVAVFFLIGIGFICKKNFRKIFQRLLGRIPRCFCDQLTFSIIQVWTHFLEFLKICRKMFPFFR